MARYLDVRKALAAEIAAGKHPVGSRFPTDQELCERFDVSRHTVREALRELQNEELIIRQRGSGTIVGEGKKRTAFHHGFTSLSELDSYALGSQLVRHSEGVVILKPFMAELLDCEAGSKWLRVAGLRFLHGADMPLGWTEIFVAEQYIESREKLFEGSAPVFEQIAKIHKLTIRNVEQQIRATTVPKELQDVLGCEENMPALLVRRKYFDEFNRVFEMTLSVHPADRYVHSMSIPRLDRDPS